MHKIFEILMQRKDLDINIVNKEGKTSFQLAIENNNFYFLEEILKLNPQLCFIDQKGNSVFHSLIAFIYEHKIPQDKKLYVINEILDRLKDNLSDDELNRISNSYDENGFTPLLKLMYEYSQKITTIFNNIKQEETYNFKKNKVLQAENNKDIIMKENNEEEEEEEINIGNNNFENFNNNNPNQTLDNKISSMNLSKNELDEIHVTSLSKLDLYIQFLYTILKKYILLKMNPNIKVGKLATYRKSPTNTENRKDANDNDTKNLSKKNSYRITILSWSR